jgi:hypothetical protein
MFDSLHVIPQVIGLKDEDSPKHNGQKHGDKEGHTEAPFEVLKLLVHGGLRSAFFAIKKVLLTTLDVVSRKRVGYEETRYCNTGI